MAPLPASALAFVTTIHVGLTLLRKHRTLGGVWSWVLLPSLVLCAAPWVYQSAVGLVAGLAVHAAWFAACEWLAPGPARATDSRNAVRTPDEPASARGFTPAAVLSVRDETPTIRTFRLARPAGTTFSAGQFLTVRVDVNGVPQVRCYSVSSAPQSASYLEISVKRQGLVSGALHATVQAGSRLLIKPPAGKFVYPAGDGSPLVCVAGGVGITPLISMIRHASVSEPSRPITLLYSARGPEELAFADELSRLRESMPNLRVLCTVTSGQALPPLRAGRIDAGLIRDTVPDPAAAVFLLCGPEAMIRELERALLESGVARDRIRYEVFQATRAIGAAAGSAAASAAAAASHVLTLQRSDVQTTVSARDTLLDAAEGAGVLVPSLCRSGVCCTCRTRLVAGAATCTSDALDEGERAEGWVLPCVTWAAGDCTLDA